MNIYQRIAEVQKVCSYLKKDTDVGSGSYGYKGISHDGVLNFTRAALIEQGIVVSVSQQSKGVSVPGTTKSGTAKIRFEAIYNISFINIEKPEEMMVVSVEAHGEDSNDKAPGKAISYATKTAMLKTFLIETGENDEVRMEESMPEHQDRPFNIKDDLTSCKSIDELKKVFSALSKEDQQKYLTVKDDMKIQIVKSVMK